MELIRSEDSTSLRIRKSSIDDKEEVRIRMFDLLISKSGKFSPCCGCVDRDSAVCIPGTCVLLNEWILD